MLTVGTSLSLIYYFSQYSSPHSICMLKAPPLHLAPVVTIVIGFNKHKQTEVIFFPIGEWKYVQPDFSPALRPPVEIGLAMQDWSMNIHGKRPKKGKNEKKKVKHCFSFFTVSPVAAT